MFKDLSVKKLTKKAQQGFTIIEVMIVLAIAGLILAVVLVAIPQLQKSQRDSAKQAVVSRVVAEIGNFGSNNNGQAPWAAGAVDAGFTSTYLSGVDIKNPETGVNYTPTIKLTGAFAAGDPATKDEMAIYPGGSCKTPESAGVGGTYGATSRKFAIKVQLERTGIMYCADNN